MPLNYNREYTVCVICITVVFLFADQNLLAPNLSAIAKEFDFTDSQRDDLLGGRIAIGFFIIGGFISIISGYLADSVNRIYLFSLVVFIGESSCLATYWSKTYIQLYICRVFTGISIGGATPITFSLLADLYHSKSRTLISTIVGVAMSTGIALGQLLAGILGPTYGWRLPFLIIASPTLLFAFLLMVTGHEPLRGSQEDEVRILRHELNEKNVNNSGTISNSNNSESDSNKRVITEENQSTTLTSQNIIEDKNTNKDYPVNIFESWMKSYQKSDESSPISYMSPSTFPVQLKSQKQLKKYSKTKYMKLDSDLDLIDSTSNKSSELEFELLSIKTEKYDNTTEDDVQEDENNDSTRTIKLLHQSVQQHPSCLDSSIHLNSYSPYSHITINNTRTECMNVYECDLENSLQRSNNYSLLTGLDHSIAAIKEDTSLSKSKSSSNVHLYLESPPSFCMETNNVHNPILSLNCLKDPLTYEQGSSSPHSQVQLQDLELSRNKIEINTYNANSATTTTSSSNSSNSSSISSSSSNISTICHQFPVSHSQTSLSPTNMINSTNGNNSNNNNNNNIICMNDKNNINYIIQTNTHKITDINNNVTVKTPLVSSSAEKNNNDIDISDIDIEYSEKIDCTKIVSLFTNRSAVLVFLQGVPACLPWGMIYIFLNDYFSTERHLSVFAATLALTLFGIGGLIGQFSGGLLGQYLYNHDKTHQCILMGVSTIVSVLPMIYILNTPTPGDIIFYIVTTLGGFIVSMNGPNVRAVLQNVCTPETRGSAFALFNLTDDLGKGAGPWLVVYIIQACGQNRIMAFNIVTMFWCVGGIILLLLVYTVESDERIVQMKVRHALRTNHYNRLNEAATATVNSLHSNHEQQISSQHLSPISSILIPYHPNSSAYVSSSSATTTTRIKSLCITSK